MINWRSAGPTRSSFPAMAMPSTTTVVESPQKIKSDNTNGTKMSRSPATRKSSAERNNPALDAVKRSTARSVRQAPPVSEIQLSVTTPVIHDDPRTVFNTATTTIQSRYRIGGTTKLCSRRYAGMLK